MGAEVGVENAPLKPAAAVVEDASVQPTADAGVQGPPPNLTALERALVEEPNSFGFFQAVHLLERLYPGRTALGGFGDPAEEVVRIGVNPRLGFPASEIQSLDMADGDQPRMSVNFTGLTGPSGVLPYTYATLVIERLLAGDTALAAFLDLFHHRMTSLFYAGWEKHRFELRYRKEGVDPLTHHLRDLAGLGLEAEERIGEVPAAALAGYVALLGPEPRSAVALEQMLSDYFDVPVRVEQFIGRWYPVASAELCFLDSPAAASSLGQGALIGDEVLDPQGGVRIRIGPMGREAFDSFLPTGDAHEALRTLLELFGHGQFEFEVQLVLAADEVEGVVLGAPGEEKRLAWTSWIATAAVGKDAEETVLRM